MLESGVEHGADDEGVAVPAGVEDGADDEGVAEPEAPLDDIGFTVKSRGTPISAVGAMQLPKKRGTAHDERTHVRFCVHFFRPAAHLNRARFGPGSYLKIGTIISR